MTDYSNPVTITREYSSLVKLWHVLDGVFIWEFFTTLYFEWDVIRGRRPYRWTIWIYSLTRVATLLAIILNMIGFNTTTPMHCQVWVTFQFLFSYIAFAAASFLVVLRVIAIWNTEKSIILITMGVWLANVSSLIEGLVRIRSVWSSDATTCTLLNLETNKPAVISTLATDVVLLSIMIIGLFRMHLETDSVFALGRVLWKQGLIWLVVATLAAVPPTVFMCLNLNLPLNYMFQAPNMIVLAIAATRMYRLSVEPRVSPRSTPRGTRRTVISDMRVRSVPLNQTDVSVPTTEYDQYPTSQSGSGSYISTDPHERYKAHEVSFNVDVESGPEK
jgi:hypothetical protein